MNSGRWTLDSGPQRRGGIRLPGRRGIPQPIPRVPGRGVPVPRGPGPFGPTPPRIGDWGTVERPGGSCAESKPDPDLKTLANNGGGGYFELKGTDDLPATFARIADELHHQYLLAYTVPAFDGKIHTIDVRVKQKGLTVRARKSYVAAVEK